MVLLLTDSVIRCNSCSSVSDILINACSANRSVVTKKAAWAEVAEQFNAVSGGTKRDCKQLQ